jgi:hypothetical protein
MASPCALSEKGLGCGVRDVVPRSRSSRDDRVIVSPRVAFSGQRWCVETRAGDVERHARNNVANLKQSYWVTTMYLGSKRTTTVHGYVGTLLFRGGERCRLVLGLFSKFNVLAEQDDDHRWENQIFDHRDKSDVRWLHTLFGYARSCLRAREDGSMSSTPGS